MVLEQKDVLQINATVIAGAFIFLTVLTTTGATTTEILNQINAMGVALGIIIFFSQSSFFALRGNVASAVDLMKIRFLVLLIISYSF